MPKTSNCDVLIDWMAERLGEEGRRFIAESAALSLEVERRKRGRDEKPDQLERVLRRLVGRIGHGGTTR